MAAKTDAVSFRVPYRNLKKEAELEMATVVDENHHRIDLNSPTSSSSSSPPIPNGDSMHAGLRSKKSSLRMLILSCTVAAGVQFGWALQLSLLTPYVQVSSDLYLPLALTLPRCLCLSRSTNCS